MRAICIAALIAAGPAFAQEVVPIPVPVEKIAQCQAEGGCAIITRVEFEAAMKEVAEAAYKKAMQEAKDCRNRT